MQIAMKIFDPVYLGRSAIDALPSVAKCVTLLAGASALAGQFAGAANLGRATNALAPNAPWRPALLPLPISPDLPPPSWMSTPASDTIIRTYFHDSEALPIEHPRPKHRRSAPHAGREAAPNDPAPSATAPSQRFVACSSLPPAAAAYWFGDPLSFLASRADRELQQAEPAQLRYHPIRSRTRDYAAIPDADVALTLQGEDLERKASRVFSAAKAAGVLSDELFAAWQDAPGRTAGDIRRATEQAVRETFACDTNQPPLDDRQVELISRTLLVGFEGGIYARSDTPDDMLTNSPLRQHLEWAIRSRERNDHWNVDIATLVRDAPNPASEIGHDDLAVARQDRLTREQVDAVKQLLWRCEFRPDDWRSDSPWVQQYENNLTALYRQFDVDLSPREASRMIRQMSMESRAARLAVQHRAPSETLDGPTLQHSLRNWDVMASLNDTEILAQGREPAENWRM